MSPSTAAARRRGRAHDGSEAPAKTGFWALTLGSIGVVYGDIGTSPLYALRESVLAAVGPGNPASEPVVLGILSLIIWALILVVTVKYVLILLRADNNGEGGTLALMALASRALGGSSGLVILLGIISGALFYGDAIITPALSVLSAVEGLKVVTPAFDAYVVPLTVVILVALFAVQSRGTAKVAAFFGPITLIWFVAIAVAGLWHIGQNPNVLLAFNPFYGVIFLLHHGMIGFYTLGAVFLVVTGVGSALCRPRPFRPRPDPVCLAGGGAAGAHDQLSRAGRAGARRSEGDRESVLPALSGLGAAADGGAGHRRDRDREPGGDHRRLFAHPPGDPARPAAAPGNPPHLGIACSARSTCRGSTRCC